MKSSHDFQFASRYFQLLLVRFHMVSTVLGHFMKETWIPKDYSSPS